MRLPLLLCVLAIGPTITPATAAAGGSDPSTAVVAEGAYRYRQRDLDALVLIARRYLGRPFQGGEEAATRDAVRRLLVAREAFARERQHLPEAFTASQRDRLTLDILDYVAERNPGHVPGSTPTLRPDPGAVANGASATQLLTIPSITLRRSFGSSSWNLNLDLSVLADGSDETLIPLLQDALLTWLHDIDQNAFTGLTPKTCKQGAAKALADLPLTIRKVLVTAIDVRKE